MAITRRPIFATGVPRSGSSWLGAVFSTASRLRYNFEPFNPSGHPYLTRRHVYLREADDDPSIRRAAESVFAGKLRFRQLLTAFKQGYGWSTIRPADRVLVKDPTAHLMAEWIAHNYQADILIIFRHPCGFASSIYRLGWPADAALYLQQPALLEDWLHPYESLIRDSLPDFWRRVAAFWGATYTVLHGQLQRHDDWHSVLYEDLCLDPKAQFGKLFKALGMTPTPATWRMLEQSTTSPDDSATRTRRQSRSMIDIWKERLTPEQVDTVMEVVRQFNLPYYCD